MLTKWRCEKYMSTLYSGLDWLVFGLYGAMLLGSGLYFNRKKSNNTQDFFLGGNTIPTWMVAISILATSQSAATFLGGPDQGYQGDLSYLATNIGAIIAAVLVTVILVPKFYQNKVFTVYELLEKRMGSSAKKQAGIMYLFGRIFASGARLYMAALAVAMILFGNIDAENVIIATIILTLVGLLYTVFSGIRTVIYSDVIQCAVYVSAAVFVIYFIYTAIPASFSQIVEALQHPAPNAPSKLALFKFDWDFSSAGVFNFWSAITGFMLLNFAAFGLDQDMTQRILTCKNAKEANKAMLLSVLLVIPVMLLFIVIGLLLFILYQRSVIVNDLYRPFKEKQTIALPESHYVKAGQVGMIVVAGALCLMAILCFYWQRYTDMPLLKFALSVMVFSYSGLLGVYFTALFTQRGNASSVFWALMIGFIVTLFFQPYVMSIFLPQAWLFDLGFTWQLCIGSFISLLVCMLGRNKKVVDNNLTASLDS